MTGEMSWIKPSGQDSNGETWEIQATVARALRCKLRPFDAYLGPYINHQNGKIFISSDDGEVGTVCLWPNGIAPAYQMPVTAQYFPLYDNDAALAATRDMLRRHRKALKAKP